MLVEIPLIQRFILILDQPTFAMAAILFTILLFSGIGSQFGTPKLSLSTALILLVSLLVLYLPLLPAFLNLTLGWSLGFRLLVTMILIAPLGFLMGIPFSGGLNWIRSISEKTDLADQWMVSFVWAVNGASSVVASILASLITLSFGFSITFGVGIVFYLIAYFVYRKYTS